MRKEKTKARDRSRRRIFEIVSTENKKMTKSKRDLSLEEIEDLYIEHAKKINKKYQILSKERPNKNFEYFKHIDLKRCEMCTDFVNDKFMLLCDICDDGYHSYCLVK